jgi:hypothetical protein
MSAKGQDQMSAGPARGTSETSATPALARPTWIKVKVFARGALSLKVG